MPVIHAGFTTAEGFDFPSEIAHEIVGGTVKAVTQSKVAHAFIVMDLETGPATFEMLNAGITRTDGIVYRPDNTKFLEVYEVPVTEEQLAKLFQALQEWFDSHVGYALVTGCLGAGLASRTNAIIGNEIDEQFNEKFNTMMCSEMSTRLLRIAYPEFILGFRPGAVWPELERQKSSEMGWKLELSYGEA